MNFTSQKLPTSDGEFLSCRAYPVSERESDPILVLVHGLGGDQVAWEFLIEELLKRNLKLKTIITYDLRGHSTSTRKIASYDYLAVATTDLATVIEHFIPAKAGYILVGHSLGALISQSFLESQPKKNPSDVILLSLAGRVRGIAFPIWFTNWLFSQCANKVGRVRTRTDHQKFLGTQDIHMGRLLSDLQSTGFFNMSGIYASLGRMQASDTALHHLNVALVVGDRDTFYTIKEMQQFANKIRARLFIIKSGNHCLPTNCATQLANILLEFVPSLSNFLPPVQSP